MAYEKQTWEDGVSPVNAERLNHMEEGIAQAGGGKVAVINVSMGFDDYGNPMFIADKSYADIVADTAKGIAHILIMHFPEEMGAEIGTPVYQQVEAGSSGLCEFARWITSSGTRMLYEAIYITDSDTVEYAQNKYVNYTTE